MLVPLQEKLHFYVNQVEVHFNQVEQHLDQLIEEANIKFSPLFRAFKDVYQNVNHSREVQDEDIEEIGIQFDLIRQYNFIHNKHVFFQYSPVFIANSISTFMALYRAAGLSVTPKAHMLEVHTVPFMRQWKRGLAFLSEQGGEKLHSR